MNNTTSPGFTIAESEIRQFFVDEIFACFAAKRLAAVALWLRF